jgi:hypothetical protein
MEKKEKKELESTGERNKRGKTTRTPQGSPKHSPEPSPKSTKRKLSNILFKIYFPIIKF